MKKQLFFIILFLIGLIQTPYAVAQQATWTNDPTHSHLGFEIRHMGISWVKGKFDDFKVTALADENNFNNAKITLVAQTKSVNTGVEARDNHLRTADFFDVATYPELRFESTHFNIDVNKSDRGILIGNLTMHGVTRQVKLSVYYSGTIVNAKTRKKVAGFRVTGVIPRADFGIGTKFLPAMIGGDVYLSADLEFSPAQ